jgi:hypothetical protein
MWTVVLTVWAHDPQATASDQEDALSGGAVMNELHVYYSVSRPAGAPYLLESIQTFAEGDFCISKSRGIEAGITLEYVVACPLTFGRFLAWEKEF